MQKKVGRVATCIRCQKLFKHGMDAYEGHAHLVAKVGIISRMSKNRPRWTKYVLGQEAPSEIMLFFDILEITSIFLRASYDQFKVSFQVVSVFNNSCIFWSILGEKWSINGLPWRNMHTASKFFQTCHVVFPNMNASVISNFRRYQSTQKIRIS